jgi:cohesin complex subunit SCC1
MSVNLSLPTRESHMIPDRITPYDNLDILPPPDADFLLSQIDDPSSTPMNRKGRVNNRDINLQEDFNNSQFLQTGLGKDDDLAPVELLDLDLTWDDDEPVARLEQSIEMEMGRDAGLEMDEDFMTELEMGLGNKAARPPSMDFDHGPRIADDEGDIPMGDGDDLHFNPDDNSVMPTAPHISRARISESPLSDIDDEVAREVEEAYSRHQQTDLYEPDTEHDTTIVRRPAQRAKKQRLITPDEQTMLSSSMIKDQHANRENILKPQSFLPRDPYFMALLEMHKSGGFVSNIILDARSCAWAPELRGLLSLVGPKQPNELKRKRDSGIADMESEQGASKSPRLDLREADDFGFADMGDNTGNDDTVMDLPADDDAQEREGDTMPAFDETVAPVVHPAESGPVSLGTKHAVHVLRDIFGAEAEHNADKRRKANVLLQDIVPEGRSTKADATKMFFECLVLATKDAIKVEQGPDLGAPIRVRGKRGLWGAWAEREAGGEMAAQQEHDGAPGPSAVHAASPPAPGTALHMVPTVRVEA